MTEKQIAEHFYKDATLDSGQVCFICGKDIPVWKLQDCGQGKYKHKNCKADFSSLLKKGIK